MADRWTGNLGRGGPRQWWADNRHVGVAGGSSDGAFWQVNGRPRGRWWAAAVDLSKYRLSQ
jgi:hypothetical protein